MSEDSRLGNRAVLILAAFPEWHDRDRISATARYIGPALIASPSRFPMIRQEELLSFQSVVRVANAPAFSALFCVRYGQVTEFVLAAHEITNSNSGRKVVPNEAHTEAMEKAGLDCSGTRPFGRKCPANLQRKLEDN